MSINMLEPSERVCTKDDVYVLELLIRSASNLGGHFGGRVITDFLVPIHNGQKPTMPDVLMLWFESWSAANRFVTNHTGVLELVTTQVTQFYNYRLFNVLLQGKLRNFRVQIAYNLAQRFASAVPPPGVFITYNLYASLSYTNILSFYSRTAETVQELLDEFSEKKLTIDGYGLATLSQDEFYEARIKRIKTMIAEGFTVFYPDGKTEVSTDVTIDDIKKYIQDHGLDNCEHLVYSVKRNSMIFDTNPFEIFIDTQIVKPPYYSVSKELVEIRAELTSLLNRVDKVLNAINT